MMEFVEFSGGGKKPGPKTGAARFARPLRGAEVLVAVVGPSPEFGGKEKPVLVRTFRE